jgi:hypothetical protein
MLSKDKSLVSRRGLLAGSMVVAAGLASGADVVAGNQKRQARTKRRSRTPIGLQLYSVRKE